MKNVIITGSNGMIGRLILEECLARADVKKVTSIARKALEIKNDKLVQITHQDFSNYSTIAESLTDQDVCFYCIGVYTGQVPMEEFIKITVNYTKSFAEALKNRSPNAVFCFLSGEGADSSEKSHLLFARQKGIAENILLELKFKETYIFRPGYIYPIVKRKEPNWVYKVMRILYKPLSVIYPNIGVKSKELALKMIDIGLNGGDKIIYKNKDIRI